MPSVAGGKCTGSTIPVKASAWRGASIRLGKLSLTAMRVRCAVVAAEEKWAEPNEGERSEEPKDRADAEPDVEDLDEEP